MITVLIVGDQPLQENSFRFQLAVRLLPICSQAVWPGGKSPLTELGMG